MIVAHRLRRNRKITITTSATVSSSSNSTSFTDAWIAVVRSVSGVTVTPLGRFASSCGSSRLMLFTTVIVLPPGCRCTFKMIAGCLFIHAACVLFSTPSTILATSVSITGAPSRNATTTFR